MPDPDHDRDQAGEGSPGRVTPKERSAVIRTNVMTISPDQAEQWLSRNPRNRHLSEALVDRYAQAMTRGEWQLNGDAIRFDEDENLLDGQHRLAAIVKSQIPVRSLVIHGVPVIAQDTMDTGRKRTMADVLTLRGEQNATTLAGALNILYRLETGKWAGSATPTNQQAFALLSNHPDLRASIPVGARAARRVRSLRAGIGAALHYHFSHLDDLGADADAKDFFERLISGTNLDESSPILTLRHALERAINDRATLSATRIVALTIKAWNAYRDGTPVHVLRWAPGGSRPEAFPKAH